MATPKASSFSGRHGLGQVRTIPEFREFVDDAAGLSRAQRRTLVDQAIILIRDLYVHLPLKRAMHAIDPEQRLRLLRHRMDDMTDRAFHAELLGIFTELRDLHTNYVLPAPFGGRIAFLGILLERYFEDGEPRCMVSKVAPHLVAAASLTEGAVVTHWNGVPIELAIWRNADREAGSNPAARMARGLENMTLRIMATSLPPDEDWVDLRYRANGDVHETRLIWRVYDDFTEIVAGAADPQGLIQAIVTPLRYQVGVDLRTEIGRRAKKQLFSPAAVREERRVKKYKGEAPRATAALRAAEILPTSRPDDLTARIVDTEDGSFGYLRLWTFHMKDQNINAFVSEVIRLLESVFPAEGLIIDVRGNGGGYIIAAEFLLQLLTPRRIEPEPTQFINTDATLDLTGTAPFMDAWRPSISAATETGAQYSAAIPLSEPEVVNAVGQIYHGPVVLITDAFCYSACDMFAAGFKDHEIGKILGVDAATGAGGANVLTHSRLRQDWQGGPLRPLPQGADMRVSLRRTLRVGNRAGQPVEDLGVEPDVLHEMTADDLLQGNRDLLNAAGRLLAAGTVRSLEATVADMQGRDVTIDVTTDNITSVDAYVDGRPQQTASTSSGSAQFVLRLPATIPQAGTTVRFEGFHGGRLVAARQLGFEPG